MAVEPSGKSSSASSPVNIGNGKSCHQCRQSRDIVAACKNLRNKKPCLVKICNKCLLNRYGEKAEEVNMFQEWSCPKCRGICNCSVCMKRKGQQPTGILMKTVKATGFSSVLEMLSKNAERANHENVDADMNTSLEKEVVSSPKKTGKENSFAGKVDANLPELVEKNSKNMEAMLNGKTDDSTSSKKINNNDKRKSNHKGVKDNHDTDLCGLEKKPKKMKHNLVDKTSNSEVVEKNKEKTPLPVGTDLISVAGLDVCAEDVGNALQFLEFCSVFGKILDMKNGEAEYILEDILHGLPARRGKNCLTVMFHMRLLSILADQGEKSASISFNGKNSWFAAVKNLLSESPHIPKKPGLEFLEKADDYDNLNASEKLRVVNLLCDEILGTQKLRNWIDHQNSQFREKAKGAKNLLNASSKEITVSRSKSEAAQAHAKLPESKGLLLKKNCTCDAIRIDPIFIERRGRVYWKLNCCGASDVLYQNVKKGNTLTLDEKWFSLDDEGKEMIEKHITSSRIK